MALVDSTTGEVVAACTPEEARSLTDSIRDAAEQVWSLLLEAHDRQAYAALGYATWADYVRDEFDMSRSRSYQMLDQGRVIRAIEHVASTSVDITEAAARDIKPNLKVVTDAIKDKIAEEATVEPERVKEIAAQVIDEERAKVRQAAEDRAALVELNEVAAAAGMDQDRERTQQRGAFSRLCRDLSELPEPSSFIAYQSPHLTPRHVAQAERAHAWLDAFLLEIGESK